MKRLSERAMMTTKTIAYGAASTALVAVATMLGFSSAQFYFNLGDALILLVSAIFGPVIGMIAGTVIAEEAGCALVIRINKTDLDPGDRLYELFGKTGYPVVRTSAETGEGTQELVELLRGKVSAFTGNSGVGKSSILNVLLPGADIKTGEVSEKLGRGRHTTRHVELFSLGDGTYIADTPGFASLDVMMTGTVEKEQLQYDFIEFAPCLGRCRFHDCAHLKEPDCAVIRAVAAGEISPSRYRSYLRLYEISAQHKFWEYKEL